MKRKTQIGQRNGTTLGDRAMGAMVKGNRARLIGNKFTERKLEKGDKDAQMERVDGQGVIGLENQRKLEHQELCKEGNREQQNEGMRKRKRGRIRKNEDERMKEMGEGKRDR